MRRAASRRIDRAEARRLLEQVCACSHADLIAHPEREMNPMQVERFEALVARREAGEPLAYLLGSAWFAGLEFAVTPDVLIPRPDTEVLVDLACARAQEMREPRIVDLGTGSGIIPIVRKRCPRTHGLRPSILSGQHWRWPKQMPSGMGRSSDFLKVTGLSVDR